MRCWLVNRLANDKLVQQRLQMGWLASAPCSLTSCRNLAGLLHMVVVTKDPGALRDDKPEDTSTFQVSPCIVCFVLSCWPKQVPWPS